MIKWLAQITLSWGVFDITWNMASKNLSTDSEGGIFQVLEGVVCYGDPTTLSNAMNAFVADWQQRACRYSLSRKHSSLQAFVRHVVEHAGLREWTVYCTVCVISLFINDMQDDPVCTLRLFAGDALLYHKITHNDDTLALQRDQDKLGLWADRWQMLFSPSKCYKMSVFRSRSPVVKDYTLYNQTLVAVQQHPYLGVLLCFVAVDSCGQHCWKGELFTCICEKELVCLLWRNQMSSICITCQATSRVCDCSMGSL